MKKFNIGLFGGETIGRVVLCNAITGETEDYAIEDAPSGSTGHIQRICWWNFMTITAA